MASKRGRAVQLDEPVAMASASAAASICTRRRSLGRHLRRDLEPRKRLTPANIFATELIMRYTPFTS